ncbi:flavin reductase family protein [Actinomadura sp. 9N215]|uniref:flavin reductase family protein n=1 Tax=Actinomadura sp. 9N215 TaxID=3375150 RepID=UPI0037962E98
MHTRVTAGQRRPTVEKRELRQILGRFASGVVVVTGLAEGEPAGFTCQSFSSLSLDPALVVFCPSKTSRTWPGLSRSGTFCVNILGEGQRDVSDTFARQGVDRFDRVCWSSGRRGNPRLAGALAHIECDLRAEHDGGDHHIVLGEVQDLVVGQADSPLIYFRGRYAGIRA